MNKDPITQFLEEVRLRGKSGAQSRFLTMTHDPEIRQSTPSFLAGSQPLTEEKSFNFMNIGKLTVIEPRKITKENKNELD